MHVSLIFREVTPFIGNVASMIVHTARIKKKAITQKVGMNKRHGSHPSLSHVSGGNLRSSSTELSLVDLTARELDEVLDPFEGHI
jgi:hypothetical protein